MTLRIVVYGKPEPAGSKNAYAVRKDGVPTGKIAVSDANPRAKSWQREVGDAAREAMDNAPLEFDPFVLGPLDVSMIFYVQRPKGHYGTGRNAHKLKPSAPAYPAVKPDALKLARGTEDALTGIVWRDDSQVVDLHVAKRYGLPERCEIEIREAVHIVKSEAA